MGRSQDVVILIESEFGRNSFENSNGGTDHGAGTVCTVIGSGVHGGIFGPHYTEYDFTNRPWFTGSVDFREIRWNVLSGHLQVDPAPILPESFVKSGIKVL
jgi:uncharacterized protein (DUF1501 family)